MRTLGIPQLLADLKSDAGVAGGENSVAEWNRSLADDGGNHAGEVELLSLEAFRPGGEPTRLSVAPVIAHLHFRPNQQDALVQESHSAVVDDVVVLHGHAYVDQHVLTDGRSQQLQQHFPRV